MAPPNAKQAVEPRTFLTKLSVWFTQMAATYLCLNHTYNDELSASMSARLSFPGFWVTSGTRGSICRTMLTWSFLSFHIRSRICLLVNEVLAHVVPSAWKASFLGLLLHGTRMVKTSLNCILSSQETRCWYLLVDT